MNSSLPNPTDAIPQLPPDVLRSLFDLWNVAYIQVVSLAILLYDFLITLSAETKYIWKRSWNLSTLIFLLTRYLPFIDSSMLAFELLAQNPSTSICKTIFAWKGYLYIVGIAISEWVLILRSSAIWENNKYIGRLLTVLLIVVASISTYYVKVVLTRVSFIDSPSHLAFPGCFFGGGNTSIASSSLILVVVFETAVTVITLLKFIRERQYGATTLLKSIVYNGVLVYLYLLGTTITNLIVLKEAPPECNELGLTSIYRILHAVLTERLILHIRKAADGNVRTGSSMSMQMGMPSMVFAARPGASRTVDSARGEGGADDDEEQESGTA